MCKMQKPKCIIFDCFGTVFDMNQIPKAEISDYVSHVRQANFVPYAFPSGWYDIRPHLDSVDGISSLRTSGFMCVALSNGDKNLISHISTNNNIVWDHIVDLLEHKVYKPHVDAYRTVEKDLNVKPPECLMVTIHS
jgi:FMN phosphatase YigB (HAD superfamily)